MVRCTSCPSLTMTLDRTSTGKVEPSLRRWSRLEGQPAPAHRLVAPPADTGRVRGDDVRQSQGQELLPGVAQVPAGLVVGVQDAVVGPDQVDGVRRELEQGPVVPLLFLQFGLDPDLLAHRLPEAPVGLLQPHGPVPDPRLHLLVVLEQLLQGPQGLVRKILHPAHETR